MQESTEVTGGFIIDDLDLTPKTPRTHMDMTVTLRGHIDETYTQGADLTNVIVRTALKVCRRFEDCMEIGKESFGCVEEYGNRKCANMPAGSTIKVSRDYFIPYGPIRGTYKIDMEVEDRVTNKTLAQYSLQEIELLASKWENKVRDARDALISFIVAASASHALAKLFPVFSGGLLPQISGFLCIGMIVGPYCCNLVTHMHIFMMGEYINRLSLAFIGGAAGAEIFLPEFQSLIDSMLVQTCFIAFSSVMVVTSLLMAVVSAGMISMPAIDVQPTTFARFSVALLSGALMTARSPASAIAIIAEMQCGYSKCAKMALGITVLSDIVVLIFFAVCQQVVRIATVGTPFGMGVLVNLFASIATSIMLGVVCGMCLRMALPQDPLAKPEDSLCSGVHEDHDHPRQTRMKVRVEEEDLEASDDDDDARPRNGSKGSKDPPKLRSQDTMVEARMQEDWRNIATRGLVLLGILYSTFYMAEQADGWTKGSLRLEPLLCCTVGSCVCGHDWTRRRNLLQSLSFWTPHILLPFFTLAGASLELPQLGQVLPAALFIVFLRLIGIFVGSTMGAIVYGKVWHGLTLKALCKATPVRYTWLTLIAQAGVTLGLVLEIQGQKEFRAWSRHFGTIMLGVVMINQLLGPIACRIGLSIMLKDEAAQDRPSDDSDAASATSDDNSDSSGHTPRLISGRGASIGGPPGFTAERSLSTLSVSDMMASMGGSAGPIDNPRRSESNLSAADMMATLNNKTSKERRRASDRELAPRSTSRELEFSRAGRRDSKDKSKSKSSTDEPNDSPIRAKTRHPYNFFESPG